MPTELPPRWKRHLRRDDGCYYCAGVATSDDHVPPKRFFPRDPAHRKNLIKVPSCDDHNNGFSAGDVVVAAIVSMSHAASRLGSDQFDETLRAFESDKRLHRRVIKTVIVHQEKNTGRELGTFEVDLDLFHAIIERIAKGLHFHTWRVRWPGALQVKCEQFVNSDLTMPVSYPEMFKALREMFFAEPVLGDNPRVFHYQWHDGYIDGQDHRLRIVAMRFYDGVGVYAWGPPPP